VLGIYFPKEIWDLESEKGRFQCVFCEHTFVARTALSLHYFETHAGAFSAEELVMACSRHSHLP
jgi:hypothetical protein